MKKSKRILATLGMGTGLALAGINVNSNKVHADTINSTVHANDMNSAVYTTTQTTYVYSDINNPVKPIQTLNANTNWKIIRTAYDKFGNKWLDLGENQWVKVEANKTNKAVKTEAPEQTQAAPVQAQNTPAQTEYQVPRQTPSYRSYQPQNRPTQNSNASASANSGLASIAQAESGNSYTARNGQYIGKYQLSASYLHGDYSPANQERVARQYAISRYGSISAATAFHQTHGWW